MADHLLTLNAGSSSVKFALFDRDAPTRRRCFGGQVDGIGLGGGGAAHARRALADVLAQLRSRAAAHRRRSGHRIVHGGADFDAAGADRRRPRGQAHGRLEPLAPLHQPHNLAGVRAARLAFAGVPQVACFDTAFHAQQPELQPPLRAAAAPVRCRRAALRLPRPVVRVDPGAADGRRPGTARRVIVVAHLGNGASMCAMHQGRSVATTMSFSPLDGLPMGTRCGRLDAAVVLHLIQQQRPDPGAGGATAVSADPGCSGCRACPATCARSRRSEPCLRRRWPSTISSNTRCANSPAWRPRCAASTCWCSPAASAKTRTCIRQRIVDGAAWLGAFETRVLRTNEEAVIARHTAALA